LGAVRKPLAVDRAQSAYGVLTRESIAVHDPWLARPSGLPPQVHLVAQSGLAEHPSVRAGRLPRTNGEVTAETAEVEAAVTAETAEKLHIEVGSVIHVPAVSRPP